MTFLKSFTNKFILHDRNTNKILKQNDKNNSVCLCLGVNTCSYHHQFASNQTKQEAVFKRQQVYRFAKLPLITREYT